jgi:hypothetical protein
MKKDTFKNAHELNEQIVAVNEQLEIWQKAEKFDEDLASLSIAGPEKWDKTVHADTSFVPFGILKAVMVGTLSTKLKELQSQFEAL